MLHGQMFITTQGIFYVTAGGSKASKASDVAVSCLEKMVIEYQSHHVEHTKDIAAVVFRLLIIHPKVSSNLLQYLPFLFFCIYSHPQRFNETDP